MIVVSEQDFMRQVTDLATLLGWSWVHFRPARTASGWRTPVSGPLGKGWPDLLLVKDDRIVLAELKRDGAKATPEQERVLRLLGATGAGVFIWRPADFPAIAALLGAS